MKDHFRINHRGMRFRFIPPSDTSPTLQIAMSFGAGGVSSDMTIHWNAILQEDLVALGLLYKAIGYSLAIMQPGYIDPVPDGDPNYIDAMKLDHEVNRLYREGNAND